MRRQHPSTELLQGGSRVRCIHRLYRHACTWSSSHIAHSPHRLPPNECSPNECGLESVYLLLALIMACIAVPVAFAARWPRWPAAPAPWLAPPPLWAPPRRWPCAVRARLYPPRRTFLDASAARSALGASSGVSGCSRDLLNLSGHRAPLLRGTQARDGPLRILEGILFVPRGRAYRIDAAKWRIASARALRTRSHHKMRIGGSYAAERSIIRGPSVTSILHGRTPASLALERRFGMITPYTRMRGWSAWATGGLHRLIRSDIRSSRQHR